MFPIYGSNLCFGQGSPACTPSQGMTLAALTTLDPTATGVRALGFTNALFVEVDGNAAYDPPGVQLAP
jgi:hypothetical protein